MKYEIKGDNLPVVICHLEKGESMITDSGAMSWMDPVMEMETTSGGFGKAFGRMFSGETMFQNRYHAKEDGMIAFASSFPGSIEAVEINPNHEIIVQKHGLRWPTEIFLLGEKRISVARFVRLPLSHSFKKYIYYQ